MWGGEAYSRPGSPLPKCRGIDISKSMLRRAVALNPHTNCEIVLNDSDWLTFPSGQFDLIYTALALQHVPAQESIRSYIAEFGRVLKTGGLLVVQLPNHVPLRRRLQACPRIYAWFRSAGLSERLLTEDWALTRYR